MLRIAEKKEDWLEAGIVYKEILEGLTFVYEEELLEMDDDEEINVIAGDCVEGLDKCLGRCDDDAIRQDWLGRRFWKFAWKNLRAEKKERGQVLFNIPHALEIISN